MGISDLMIPSHDDSYRGNFYEASKDPLVEVIEEKECGCYKIEKVCNSDCCWLMCAETVTSYYLCPEHMREHLTPVSTSKQEGSVESCKKVTMNTSDALGNVVDQFTAFPMLEDFNASSRSEALEVDRRGTRYGIPDCVNTYF